MEVLGKPEVSHLGVFAGRSSVARHCALCPGDRYAPLAVGRLPVTYCNGVERPLELVNTRKRSDWVEDHMEHLTCEAVGTQLRFCCVRQQRSNHWARYTQRSLMCFHIATDRGHTHVETIANRALHRL